MGQLERYGLYVLCLVIFLILGVAIWGGGTSKPADAAVHNLEKPLNTEETKLNEFEDYLKKRNARALEKQEFASDFFKPAEQGKTGEKPGPQTHPVDPGPGEVVAAPVTHTVKSGENLEEIAKRYLGKRHLWKRIKAINPGVNERNLKVGTVLQIPPRSAPSQPTTNVAAAGNNYTIRKGDSPWGIARDKYGSKRATEYAKKILELNGIADASALKPGKVIKLPAR